MTRLLCAVLLLAAAGARAQDAAVRFHGYAYHLDSGRYAFTEVVEQRMAAGQWVGGSTVYYLPDGRELGRKTLDFSADPFVPVYRLELQDGYVEGISDAGPTILMSRGAERAAVERAGLVTADAGLPRLLRAHFDALLRGETLPFRVVAPSRLETYRFRARRVEPAPFEGRPAERIRVDMDSMLKMFAGPLFFTFDGASRRLLEFRGVTNVIDPATREPFKVRISYFTTAPEDAPKLPPLK